MIGFELVEDDIIEVTAVLYCPGQNQRASNRWYYKVRGLTAAGTWGTGDVGASLCLTGAALYAGVLTDDAQFRGVITRVIGPALRKSPGFKTSSLDVGDVTGDMCPPGDAVLIRRYDNFGGRSGTGRVFIPFIPVSFLDAPGDVASASVTSYSDLAAFWAPSLAELPTGHVFTSGGVDITLDAVLAHKSTTPGQWVSTQLTNKEFPLSVYHLRGRSDQGRKEDPGV